MNLMYDEGMGKILAIVAMILGAGIIGYWLSGRYDPFTSRAVSPLSSDNQLVSQRLDALETSVAFLMKRVTGKENPNFLEDKSSVESRLSTLETQVASLSAHPTPSGVPAAIIPTPAKLPPVYIPLGWQASSTSFDWTVISSQQFVVDTGDYSGLESAEFQVEMRVFEGNGRADATLYDATNNLPIWSAQVSTSSQDYTWVYSSPFQLPSGKHTYKLELKSLTGYSADVEDARLKINF